MCSRTLSDTANMSRHGSTLCSPTVEKILCRSPISQRSHIGSLRQTIQGKGVIHKRVETAGVYPLVPPPGRRRCLPSCAPARRQRTPPPRGAARSRRRRRRTPVEVQRKTHRPLGANRLRGSCAPDNWCRKRCCPDRAYYCATRVLSIVCAEKERNSCFCVKKARSFLRKSAKSRIVGIKI